MDQTVGFAPKVGCLFDFQGRTNSMMRLNVRSSSAECKDLRMKFEIMGLPGSKHTLGFLYDPIFVENGKNTYLIYWGRAETNEELARHIVGHKENDRIFHTFTFPTTEVCTLPTPHGLVADSSQKVWYYIGAHEWSVVEFRQDLWPDDRKVNETSPKYRWQNLHNHTGTKKDGEEALQAHWTWRSRRSRNV